MPRGTDRRTRPIETANTKPSGPPACKPVSQEPQPMEVESDRPFLPEPIFAATKRKGDGPLYIRDPSSGSGSDDSDWSIDSGSSRSSVPTPRSLGRNLKTPAKTLEIRREKRKIRDLHNLNLKQKGVYCSVADECTSPAEHVKSAEKLQFPKISKKALVQDLQEAIEYTNSTPVEERKARRKAVLGYWRWRRQQVQAQTESVFPIMMKEMLEWLNMGGSDFCRRLEEGFPLIGIIDDHTVFPRTNRTRPLLSKKDLLDSKDDQLRDLRRILKNDPDAAEVWASLELEVERGHMEGPFKIDQDGNCAELPNSFLPLRRFIVPQRNKRRPCDNARRARLNQALAVRTPVKLISTDHHIIVLQSQMKSKPGVEFKSYVADHRDAYRQLKVKEDHKCLAVVVAMRPGSDEMFAFPSKSLLFGEAAAVSHYNNLSYALQSIWRRGLGIPSLGYFDDYSGSGEAPDAAEQLEDMVELAELLGTEFKKEKQQLGNTVEYLGLEIMVKNGKIMIGISEEKIKEIENTLHEALRTNKLPPATAAKLAGRLSWSQTQYFGRYGRAHIGAFYHRQHAPFHVETLNEQLKNSIKWWLENLRVLSARRTVSCFDEDSLPPLLLYTDAAGNGGCGAVLIDPATKSAEFFREKETDTDVGIAALEARAVNLSLATWSPRFKSREAFIFIDNIAAQAALQRGYSNKPHMLAETRTFWEQAINFAPSWFERVPTKCNPADAPSRGTTPELPAGYSLKEV